MKGRIFEFLVTFFALFFVGAISAYASQTNPSFPSCSNPQGSIMASYSDGTHGVPGDSKTYTGSDNVYAVNGNQVLQCFCGGTSGIQTNWWKVGNLSTSDISYWQSLGWTYIPDGSAWGLDSTGYLAYNAGYTCANNNPNSGGNAGRPGDGTSDGLGCANHDCSGNQVGGPATTTTGTGSQNATGNFIENAATDVLGATDPTTTDSINLTKSVCAACFWWPVLLGEVLALVALYLVLKRGNIKVNKYLLGTIVGLAAYLIFLILNKGHVCPDAGIGFWNWSIPCRYFWMLDAVMILLFSWLIRKVVATPLKKSPSKRK